MSDYKRKRCVVCNRVGGIDHQANGIYVCTHCGTPYIPHSAMAKQAEPSPAPPPPDRLIWFSYRHDGETYTGVYDCPVQPPGQELMPNDNRLRFWKYLAEKGYLADDAHADANPGHEPSPRTAGS